MEIGTYKCAMQGQDSLTLTEYNGRHLEFALTIEEHVPCVMLRKEDAIALARDILRHYNVDSHEKGTRG